MDRSGGDNLESVSIDLVWSMTSINWSTNLKWILIRLYLIYIIKFNEFSKTRYDGSFFYLLCNNWLSIEINYP